MIERLFKACGSPVVAIVLCCARTLTAPAAPAAEQPVPERPPAAAAPGRAERRAYTNHDYHKDLLEFNHANLAGAYKQAGKRDARWDDPAEKFLELLAAHLTAEQIGSRLYVPLDRPTRADVEAAGKAAVDAGCDDPLVVHCYAAMLHGGGEVEKSLPLLHKTLDEINKRAYPVRAVWATARRTQGSVRNVAAQGLAADVAGPREHDVLADKLSGFERRQVLQLVWDRVGAAERAVQVANVKDMDDREDTDPWVRDVVAGRVEIKLAWDSRGGAFADAVGEGQWEVFFDHLGKVRDRLTRAWKLDPSLPEPCADMITVAMGGGDRLGEAKLDWFERALAAQVDYVDAYDKMVHALLPRWGGSYDEIYELGVACLPNGRYDTLVPWQFVRCVQRNITDGGGDWEGPLEDPDVYAKLMEVADGYAEAQAPRGNDAFYRSFKAAVAWRAQSYDEAAEILTELADRADPEAFAEVGAENPAAAASQAHARAGPLGHRLSLAEVEEETGTPQRALERFRRAAERLEENDPAAVYVHSRILHWERQVALESGQWAEVLPAPGARLSGWSVHYGRWSAGPDGSLTASSGATPMPYRVAVRDEAIEGPFEVSGRLEGVDERVDYAAAGIVLLPRGARYTYVSFIERKDAVEVLAAGRPRVHVDTPVDRPTEFLVRVGGGTVTVELNGKEVAKLEELPDDFFEGLRVGVQSGGDGAKFTSLKVRKLPQGEAAAEEQGE